MRNSILHPTRKQAYRIGLASTAIAAFLIGLTIAKVNRLVPTAPPDIRIAITGLETISPESGNVYLMDSEQGQVPLVGTFTVSGTNAYITLKTSPDISPTSPTYTAVYWPANATSFIPHMQFLFHDDLRQKIKATLSATWRDPQVTQSMVNLLKSPGFWPLVLSNIADKPQPNQPPANDFWQQVRSDPDFAEFFKDPPPLPSQKQRTDSRPQQIPELDALFKQLEPHFRDIFSAIVWEQPSDVPNARLVWIAKRILTDSQKPAILLVPDPAGTVLGTGATITCRRAP